MNWLVEMKSGNHKNVRIFYNKHVHMYEQANADSHTNVYVYIYASLSVYVCVRGRVQNAQFKLRKVLRQSKGCCVAPLCPFALHSVDTLHISRRNEHVVQCKVG